MNNSNSVVKIAHFNEMGLSKTILTALDKIKINQPTEVQSRAIPAILDNQHLIAIAQTGSGKTLAFVLPLLNFLEKNSSARALILAPSREMAQQIFKVIQELNSELQISTCLLIGGIPSAKQISSLKKNPRFIVATPGRLNDHLVSNKLLLQNVEYIVIDEADRMLDMGFAPQLKAIQNTLRTKRQTLMFSASFNSAVESLAKTYLNSNSVMIRATQAEEPVLGLQQTVLFIDKFKKNDRLLDELNASKGGVIVFCGNQGSCERMGQYLKDYGYDTDLIHGGLSQGHRNRVIRQFREGIIRVLVATDLIARGIDIPHVDLVINFDLPFQAEDFLHRIGRTARAGRQGQALTFVTSADGKMYQKVKGFLQNAREIKLDPNFAFAVRASTDSDAKPYKNKKSDVKRAFDPTQKSKHKPQAKTIGLLAKPAKKRNDKYKHLAALSDGLGKPSVWKKNKPPLNK